MFQLNKNEWETLMSQFVISKREKRGGTQKLPYAFTEQGSAMLRIMVIDESCQFENEYTAYV